MAKIIDGLYEKVKNGPKLMDAIKKFSLMDEKKILEKLKSGKGPNLIVKDLEPNTFGEELGDGNIYINKMYLTSLNNLVNTSLPSFEIFLTSTILHEFVHFGNTVSMSRFDDIKDSYGNTWDVGK